MINMTSEFKPSKQDVLLRSIHTNDFNKTQLDEVNLSKVNTSRANISGLNNGYIIKSIGILLMLFITLFFCTPKAIAAIEVYEFDDARQEAQYKALIEEFRCPKCQNQNLAGSDSQISKDLKRKTYDLVMAGHSDAEIREYMYERYGDFISYKPPVRPSTWILWYFPPIVLILLIIWWLFRTKARSQKKVAVINGASHKTYSTENINHKESSSKVGSSEQDSESISTSDFGANAKSTLTPNKEDITEDKLGENLSTEEAEKLKALLKKYDND